MSDDYPSDWDQRRRQVYERDGYECQECGRLGGPRGGPHGDAELHAHHKTPKSKGGSDNPSNLKTLCRSCHDNKHDHSIGGRSNKRSKTNSYSGPSASKDSEWRDTTDSNPTPSVEQSNQGSTANTDPDPLMAENYSDESTILDGYHKGRHEKQEIKNSDTNTRNQTNVDDIADSTRVCDVCDERVSKYAKFDPDKLPNHLETEIDTFYLCGDCIDDYVQITGEESTKYEGLFILILILFILGVGWLLFSPWVSAFFLISLIVLLLTA